MTDGKDTFRTAEKAFDAMADKFGRERAQQLMIRIMLRHGLNETKKRAAALAASETILQIMKKAELQ